MSTRRSMCHEPVCEGLPAGGRQEELREISDEAFAGEQEDVREDLVRCAAEAGEGHGEVNGELRKAMTERTCSRNSTWK